jgi:hypothetical protein
MGTLGNELKTYQLDEMVFVLHWKNEWKIAQLKAVRVLLGYNGE